MAYLGNTPTQQAFTPAIDYFNGNASATAFTLSRPVASVAQVQVTIDNVAQNPSSAYTVTGNTITFTSAPLTGTNNIYVYYTSPITQVIAPGQGTVTATSMVTGAVGITQLSATGTPSASTYLRGDNTWATISGIPAGNVSFFAQNSAPTGWLKANGTAVSRTTYSDLFTAIGTTFGTGDGSTTFNVPDMRGYFARGWVDNGTVDSGRSFGSTQLDQFQGHWHSGVIDTAGVAVPYTGTGSFGSTTKTGDPVTGNNGTVRFGNETRPVNVAFLACIKY